MKITDKISTQIHRLFLDKCLVFMISGENADIGTNVQIAKSIKELNEKISNTEIDEETLTERFNDSDELYYLEESGQMVAYGWVRKNATDFYVYETACTVSFSKNVNVLYDFYVNPSFRRKGYYSSLLKTIISVSEKNERLIIYALSTNENSIKGIKKSGFSFVGEVSYFKRKINI